MAKTRTVAARRGATLPQRAVAARLALEIADLKAQLHAEVLRNATPALTIAAAEGHLLIVACEGLSMRVRTRSVSVSTSKTR